MEVKLIGLIGGMSWESTVPYYRIINQEVRRRLGGLHSAEVILYSFNFQKIEKLQHEGRWDDLGRMLARAASALEGAGAELLVLCTNTMHRVAPAIESAIRIPLLHIADATAEEVKRLNLDRLGLLGTKFTMEQDFYRDRLQIEHGISILIPCPESREAVHRIIYAELCRGIVRESSRQKFKQIIEELIDQGAQGIVLGCTEISLLLKSDDVDFPLIDTTEIHAVRAASLAVDGH